MVDINDEMWYTNGTKYDSGIENTPSSQGRVRRAVVNRLVNADFSSGWTQTKAYSSDTYALDSSVTCLAMKSAKVVKKGAGEFKSTSQAKLFKSGKYTFSAYVKTTGLTVPDGKKGAFLRVTIGDSVYESEPVVSSTAAREMNTFAGGWERMYVTFPFTRPEGMDALTPSNVTVSIVCDASKGTAYFAAPQVESGEIANMFNLVVNGDFSVTKNNTSCPDGTRLFPENWTTLGTGLTDKMVLNMQTGVVTDRAENKMPETVEGNALRLFSFPTVANIYMSQAIRTYGNKNDVFVLGGWVNSHTVQAGYTLSKPTIRVRFLKAADSQWTSWNNLFFTTENDNWHHMTTTIAAPYAYARIEVSVSYPQNNKTCMFSQIYLYRDLYGSSYTYDDHSNILNVKSLTNQQSQATYDSFNNRLSYVEPGSASTEKYTFTYGDTDAQKKRHLQLSAATPMGVKSSTTYDQYGNSTANVVQPSADAPLMKTETVYTSNGNYVLQEIDARGKVVSNTIDNNGQVTFVDDAEGNRTTYLYDSSDRIEAVMASAGGKDYKARYSYVNDRLTSVYHNTDRDLVNDVSYNFEYDALGRKTVVKAGSLPLSTNIYSNDRKGLLDAVNYGNGARVRYGYDDFGRTIAIYADEPDPANPGSVIESTEPKYEFLYDARGTASVVKDNVLMTETRVTSDLADRPCETVTKNSNGNTVHKNLINYDSKNRLKEFIDILPDSAHKSAYTYDADDRMSEIKFDDSDAHKVNYTYDLLNRVTNRTVTNGTALSTNYTYAAGDTVRYGAKATTPLIETITHGSGAGAVKYAYAYDNRGNIISETKYIGESDVGVTTSYEYDEIGQLIRVNDPNDTTAGANGTTWVYEYDRGGNILNKTAYTYEAGSLSSDCVRNWQYTYGDSNWKDKLTAFDGVSITSDAIGNPTNDGTWAYQWNAGRQLKNMVSQDTAVTYTYNHLGLRTGKVVQQNQNTVTTRYTLHGKLITSMSVVYTGLDEIDRQDNLYFYYDAQSRPCKVSFNGDVYTFVHNLHGDVVGIANSAGVFVVEYKYDAWGKLLGISGTMAQTLGKRNPFRYRGYVYDDEIGLYYLNTRYYSPLLSRFIQIDFQCGSAGTLLTSNMYCYCNNEPIDLVDSDGMWPSFKELVSAVVAIATAVVVTAAVIAAAPAAACTATLGLMYYGASYTVATTLANVGVATLMSVGIYGTADSTYASITGYSPVKEIVFQGDDEAYEYFQLVSTVATGGVFQLAANSPGACFVEGTLVAAEDGLRPIEEIKAGDYVWAEEPETGERALKRVVRTFLKEKDELVHIQVGGETITCTTEHPFYVQGKGWVAAQDLKPNDKLELRDGEDAFVDAVRYEKLDKPIPVFNFEVEGFHTYYVGAGCVLVHNTCTPDQGALDKLGKELEDDYRRTGKSISMTEAKYIDELCAEYNVPQHHGAYIESAKHWITSHTHIRGRHIPFHEDK